MHLFIYIQCAYICIEQKVIKVSVGCSKFYNFVLILCVNCIKFFVHRLHFLIGALKLLIGGQQFLICSLELFIARFRFLHSQLQIPVTFTQRIFQFLNTAVLEFSQVKRYVNRFYFCLFFRFNLHKKIFPF